MRARAQGTVSMLSFRNRIGHPRHLCRTRGALVCVCVCVEGGLVATVLYAWCLSVCVGAGGAKGW